MPPSSLIQTLLDILSGRKTSGTIAGDIRFGGVPPSSAFLQRYTGFVEQFGEAWGIQTGPCTLHAG